MSLSIPETPGHLPGSDPRWGPAAARCRALKHHPHWRDGLPACHGCFAQAVAIDLEAALESELPAVPPPANPFLVDEFAVKKALAGRAVTLTLHEWRVVFRLGESSYAGSDFGAWLRRHGVTVRDVYGALVPVEVRDSPSALVVPACHVEELVVEAWLAGQRVELTRSEVDAAAQRLAAEGARAYDIAVRLAVSQDRVTTALKRGERGTHLKQFVLDSRPLLGAA